MKLATRPTEAFAMVASQSDVAAALAKSTALMPIFLSSTEELKRIFVPPAQAYTQNAPAAAATSNPAAQQEQPAVDDRGIVRLRGLPFEARTQDVINFFSGLRMIPDGIRAWFPPRFIFDQVL